MSQEGSEIPNDIPLVEDSVLQLREDMVATAVKFLQNPKVSSSPLDQKKTFLKKKGLTDLEVDIAVERSGITNVHSAESSNASHSSIVLQQSAAIKPDSTWTRLRDYSSLAVLFGGVMYALYSFYKKFIEPLLQYHHKKQNEQLTRLEETITQLSADVNKNIKKLQNQVVVLRDQLADQNSSITMMTNNLTSYKNDVNSSHGVSSTSVGALQTEIASLKGLLLSSRQFPAAPAINPPVIPSWQLKDDEATSSLSSAGGEPTAGDVAENRAATSGGGGGITSALHGGGGELVVAPTTSAQVSSELSSVTASSSVSGELLTANNQLPSTSMLSSALLTSTGSPQSKLAGMASSKQSNQQPNGESELD